MRGENVISVSVYWVRGGADCCCMGFLPHDCVIRCQSMAVCITRCWKCVILCTMLKRCVRRLSKLRGLCAFMCFQRDWVRGGERTMRLTIICRVYYDKHSQLT